MGAVIPFPARRPVVFVDVCEQDGGCWGIYSQRHGHSAALVATRLALPDAAIAAREVALQLGGDFLDDAPPEQPGAA